MFKEDLLKNKVILVTGGGTGLGKSMATRFGELGANLIIGSRRADVIAKAAQELKQTGAEVLGVKCDVRLMDQVNEMVSAALDKFGRIDILLNNFFSNGKLVYLARGVFEHYCVNRTGKNKRMDKLS